MLRLRYFFARYLRYLLDKGMVLFTVTFLSSVSTLTESPRLPVLFWTCEENGLRTGGWLDAEVV